MDPLELGPGFERRARISKRLVPESENGEWNSHRRSDSGDRGAAAGDGEDERLGRIRWSRSAPSIDQRGERGLREVTSGFGIAQSTPAVAQDPGRELVHGVLEIHPREGKYLRSPGGHVHHKEKRPGRETGAWI